MTQKLDIESLIRIIRGKKVMLDFDLAMLYGVETKSLNQSVKRNIERFPEDFMFQLTRKEWNLLSAELPISQFDEYENVTSLRSQIVTSNKRGGTRYSPYAFTENGVAMLSSVLRSPIAIQVNIGIMRVFTEMRHLATNLSLPDSNSELRQEIQALRDEMKEILADQNDINESTRAQLDAISDALAELQSERPKTTKRNPIGFNPPKE
jgi:methyl-accepting chemotaxis protein